MEADGGAWFEAAIFIGGSVAVLLGRYLWERVKEKPATPKPADARGNGREILDELLSSFRRTNIQLEIIADALADMNERGRLHVDDLKAISDALKERS